MADEKGVSRRDFLTSGAAAAALPLVIPRAALGGRGKPGANDRIRIGVIGVGNRSNLLIDQLPEQGEIVAVADCFLRRCEDAASRRKASWKLYQDYRRLLDHKDIDAVIVGTTDHGRVLPCIHACQAGKDVYAEKPMTLYIEEGRVLVKAVSRYKRILQVGSQQRSMAMNRIACEFVRNGGIGKVKLVQGVNYPCSQAFPGGPEEPVPESLNWDMWLGQTAMRPYNRDLHTKWMSWSDFSGGEMTNWGAHGLDQIQCALGADGSGPKEFWLLEDGPKDSVGFRYASGVTVRLELDDSRFLGGAVFIGEKGRMEIWRNNFRTDPPRMVKELPPPEEVQKWRDEVALWQAKYHMENWLDCVRTRKMPVAGAEIGQRSLSLGHLANITRRLGRRLRWDPARERFVGDAEADKLLSRARRKGYELPKV